MYGHTLQASNVAPCYIEVILQDSSVVTHVICLHVFEERNSLETKVGIMQTLALERYTAEFCNGCEGNSMVYLIPLSSCITPE